MEYNKIKKTALLMLLIPLKFGKKVKQTTGFKILLVWSIAKIIDSLLI